MKEQTDAGLSSDINKNSSKPDPSQCGLWLERGWIDHSQQNEWATNGWIHFPTKEEKIMWLARGWVDHSILWIWNCSLDSEKFVSSIVLS